MQAHCCSVLRASTLLTTPGFVFFPGRPPGSSQAASRQNGRAAGPASSVDANGTYCDLMLGREHTRSEDGGWVPVVSLENPDMSFDDEIDNCFN